jgi:hypothetical protein
LTGYVVPDIFEILICTILFYSIIPQSEHIMS